MNKEEQANDFARIKNIKVGTTTTSMIQSHEKKCFLAGYEACEKRAETLVKALKSLKIWDTSERLNNEELIEQALKAYGEDY